MHYIKLSISSFKFLIVSCFLLAIITLSGKIYGNYPDTIKIGLLIQDKSSIDALNGALLAVEKENRSIQNPSIYFQIEARDMEGPWGTGAKQSVNLVFDDAVVLIVAADGRNSHLAEQVSAKTQVPIISIQSSDPTLAQTFIPWFFSCVPGDISQSLILLNAIQERKFTKPLVISDNSYDAKMQAATFLKAGKPGYLIGNLYMDDFNNNSELTRSIKETGPDCLVFLTRPASAAAIITELENQGINPGLFGSLSFCNNEIPEDLLNILDGITLVSPGYIFNAAGQEFSRTYINRYGKKPCFTSACAYDAVNAFIESFRMAQSGRSGLKEKLSEARIEGITGQFGFDSKGNRSGKIELMTIKNGHFIQY